MTLRKQSKAYLSSNYPLREVTQPSESRLSEIIFGFPASSWNWNVVLRVSALFSRVTSNISYMFDLGNFRMLHGRSTSVSGRVNTCRERVLLKGDVRSRLLSKSLLCYTV